MQARSPYLFLHAFRSGFFASAPNRGGHRAVRLLLVASPSVARKIQPPHTHVYSTFLLATGSSSRTCKIFLLADGPREPRVTPARIEFTPCVESLVVVPPSGDPLPMEASVEKKLRPFASLEPSCRESRGRKWRASRVDGETSYRLSTGAPTHYNYAFSIQTDVLVHSIGAYGCRRYRNFARSKRHGRRAPPRVLQQECAQGNVMVRSPCGVATLATLTALERFRSLVEDRHFETPLEMSSCRTPAGQLVMWTCRVFHSSRELTFKPGQDSSGTCVPDVRA